MKHILIVLLLLSYSGIYAQVLNNNSITLSTDPRALALGEAVVADPDAYLSFRVNPALLATALGYQIVYNYRNLAWTENLKDRHCENVTVAGRSPVGNFALGFTRNDYGKIGFCWVADNPAGYQCVDMDLYDYTVSLSLARTVHKNLAIGINLNMFDEVYHVAEDVDFDIKTERAFFTDLGFVYTITLNQGLEKKYQNIKDQFILGASLGNYGSDYKIKMSKTLAGYSSALPRYLRVGFSYQLILQEELADPLLKFLVTGEYKKYLNPDKYEKSRADFYGFGFETVLFSLIAVRAGGILQPYSNIYARENEVALRFGLGLNLPFTRIGLEFPMCLQFNYGVIPLSAIGSFDGNQQGNLSTYNILLKYEKTLF